MKAAKVILLGWGAVSLLLCLLICVLDVLKTQWADEVGMGGYIYVSRFLVAFDLVRNFGAVSTGLMLVASIMGSLIFSEPKVNDY
jgi:hypothetical protein